MENFEYTKEFWNNLNQLVKDNEIIIDRPKGSSHPKYKKIIYEIDYGYIKNTNAMDGNEIDVFKGSLNNKNVNTIICTVDLLKKDIEIKILICCTEIEKERAYNFLNNSDYMKAILIKKEVSLNNKKREIIKVKEGTNFLNIYELLEDCIYEPNEEKVKNILLKHQNGEITLFGYYLDDKIIGIIGVQNNSNNIQVSNFAIHPEYRGKKIGSELMDYIMKLNKTIILETDDDAVVFYRKYGFICEEFNDEKKGKRYSCKYFQ